MSNPLKAEQKDDPWQPAISGPCGHVAHAEGWLAITTAPDFCKVGSCVVAFNSYAALDVKMLASPNVRARGTSVYRQGDLVKGVHGDAGKHVVSGTALASGYVKVKDGADGVRANGIAVARHGSACLINCDAQGNGGAEGKLVTEQKARSRTADSTVAKSHRGNDGDELKRLEALRKMITDRRVNFDATDEYVDFAQTNKTLSGLVNQMRAGPGLQDHQAQMSRALLGTAQDFLTGTAELAYEGAKLVPKLIRTAVTKQDMLLARVDAQILREKIRRGSVSPSAVWDGAVEFGKASIAPITDSWKRGDYIEALTRGAAEATLLGVGGLNARKLAKKPNKVSQELSTGRVHIRKQPKPKFSGDWDNYKTLGVDENPLNSPEGRRMVAELREKGFSEQRAINEAQRLMNSGSTLPVGSPFDAGDKFYKLVPEGTEVGGNSAYWMTKHELDTLRGLKYDQIADRMAMPLASQQGTKFQVVEVTAQRSGTVFSSVVAPTRELAANGTVWTQGGGGTQTLLVDRSRFTAPTVTGQSFP